MLLDCEVSDVRLNIINDDLLRGTIEIMIKTDIYESKY